MTDVVGSGEIVVIAEVENTVTVIPAVTGMRGPQGEAGPAGEQGDSITGPAGPAGPSGPANSLAIGTVTEGPADATITGTAPAQTLNLVLPPGDTGPAGADSTVPGPQGDPGPGIPPGGTDGQLLTKASGTDYDAEWEDAPASGPALAGDGSAITAAKSDHQHMTEGSGTSIAVGPNATTGSSDSSQQRTALGADASANQRGNTAVGGGAQAITTTFNTAVGRNSLASGGSSIAVGSSASATGARAIALGQAASVSTADTAVIRVNDLDVQRSNGTGVTRHALYSPNGTKYWLTVDDAGALVVTAA